MPAPSVSAVGGKEFQKLEPGTYSAVCTWIIGVGPQPSPWGTKEKVIFRFEVPSERVTWEKDGQELEGPAVISATRTLSLADRSNLKPELEAWRGKKFTDEELEDFSLEKVLGAPCTISVIHREGKNGRIYDEVQTISRLQKGVAKPEPEGELIGFDVRNFNQEEYDRLPEWIQKRVDDGLAEIELQERLAAEAGGSPDPNSDDFTDDDIPF